MEQMTTVGYQLFGVGSMFEVSFLSLECILKNIISLFPFFQTVSLHYAILLILLIAICGDDDWSTNNFREELIRLWFLPCILHVLIGANVVRTFHSIFLASELEIACPCPGVDRDSVACMCCAVSRAWMNI